MVVHVVHCTMVWQGIKYSPRFALPALVWGFVYTEKVLFFLIHIKRPHEPAAALSCEFAALDSLHVSHVSGLAAVLPIPGSSPSPPFMPLPWPLLTLLY